MHYIFYFAFGVFVMNFIAALWTLEMVGKDHVATDRTAYYYFLFFVALSNIFTLTCLFFYIGQNIN